MSKSIAILACRNSGSRLYGKPLQNLDVKNNITILDQILSSLRLIDCIEDIILAISEGEDNTSFIQYAKK